MSEQGTTTEIMSVNMALKSHDFYYTFTAALPGKQTINRTTVVTVPYLTNTRDLAKGDILTMQVDDAPEKKKAQKRGKTWETEAQKAGRDQKRKEKDAAPSAATRRRCAEDSEVMGAFGEDDSMYL